MSALFEKKFDSVLLFGPPGCGKGTVGKSLSVAGGHCHISSGDILRALDPTSELGKLFHSYADRGELGPDELMIDIWREHMRHLVDSKQYFPSEQLLLLDGVPRTLSQAELMDPSIDVKAILVLDVPDREVLIQRLMARGRKDDADADVLRNRQRVYDDQTSEVLAHYPVEVIFKINADQPPLQVLNDIIRAAGDILSAKFRL